MYTTLIESRPIVAAVYHGPSDTFRNFAKGAWETPFNAAAHTRAFTPSVALPGLVNCDLGLDPYLQPNAVAVYFVFDAASSTYTPVDISAPSNARQEPCTGSITR